VTPAAGKVGSWTSNGTAWSSEAVFSATAVVQSLLADDFGLPEPPWPIKKENANAHA
jgi:hypothetical protein